MRTFTLIASPAARSGGGQLGGGGPAVDHAGGRDAARKRQAGRIRDRSQPDPDRRHTSKDEANMTSSTQDLIDMLRDTLETQFQRQTRRLGGLMLRSRRPGAGGHDDTLEAALVAARRALAETAQALRRMADGTYGICERCGGRIPFERLEVLPETRLCAPCQRIQSALRECGLDPAPPRPSSMPHAATPRQLWRLRFGDVPP
jgi:DnaK suppressor protein